MRLLFALAIVIFSGSVLAEQESFSATKKDKKIQYDYQWTDARNQQHELSFQLDAKNVFNDYRHFKALHPSLIKAHTLRAVKKSIAQYDPKKGRIKLIEYPNSVGFEYSSTDQNWLNRVSSELKATYDKSLTGYIHDQYYTQFQHFNYRTDQTVYYRPDHKRFALESQASLKPLVDVVKTKMNRATARQVAKFILSWLQTIPYNEMTSRTESNGAGFLPPIKVIANNQGDCDSKVTLMASIMKAIFPRMQVIVLYVPKHALIGLRVSKLNTDEVLRVQDYDFVLAEPVGPGLIEFAEISERSKRYIDSGNYTVDMF